MGNVYCTASQDFCISRSSGSSVFVCPKCSNIFEKLIDYENHMEENNCFQVSNLITPKGVQISGLQIQLPEVRVKRLDTKLLLKTASSPVLHPKKIRKQGLVLKKTNFQCHICKKALKYKRNLDRHIKFTHENRLSFKCDFCQKKFNYKKNLNTHVTYLHKNRNSFNCNLCNRIFNLKTNLNFHILEAHTDIHQFSCDYCEYKSNRKLRFLGHVKNCIYKNTKAKKSGGYSNFRQQQGKKSKNGGKFAGQCPICPVLCSSIPALINHVQTHSNIELRKPSKDVMNKTLMKDYPRKVQIKKEEKLFRKNGPCTRSHKRYWGEIALGKDEAKMLKSVTFLEENPVDDYLESDRLSFKIRKKKSEPPAGHERRKSKRKITKKCDMDKVWPPGKSNNVFDSDEDAIQKRIALGRALELIYQKSSAEEDLTKYQCNFCYMSCLNAAALDGHMKRHE